MEVSIPFGYLVYWFNNIEDSLLNKFELWKTNLFNCWHKFFRHWFYVTFFNFISDNASSCNVRIRKDFFLKNQKLVPCELVFRDYSNLHGICSAWKVSIFILNMMNTLSCLLYCLVITWDNYRDIDRNPFRNHFTLTFSDDISLANLIPFFD